MTQWQRIVAKWLLPIFLLVQLPIAQADLRVPTWYDSNAVNVAPDWHYRVPINVPAGATVNSTIKVDVDFAALLSQMGVSGTFDINSPRVVRSTGALSTNQEYTDSVYAGATDSTGNNRGEVRFILEDAGAVTYYLYFDITQNGTKSANPQVPINGNFEVGATGAQNPTNWTATKANANFDAQIRPSENPSVTTDGNNQTKTTDGTPNTGLSSYMIGARTNNEPSSSKPAVTLTRSIVVPSSSAGNLVVRYRPEGWDSSANGSNNYDFLTVQIVGSTTTNVVAPALNNYTTLPFSPNLNTAQATATASGYGQYNGYDCDTAGTHRSGMTLACYSEPWFTATVSLSAFAGQTVTLRITSSHTTLYKTWFHIDDVEWSVVAATLGTPQAYGVNITLPAAATTFTTGQMLSIRAQVDAQPTASSNPVTADVYDQNGALVATGIILYNDGTHGDATANDAVWSNNGSVPANPTYTIPVGVPSGSNWLLRVYARDASTSTIGATNGLIHIPGQPNTPYSQANYYNIDEILFTVNSVQLTNLKTVAVLNDPYNGTTNPKNIPGAEELYTITITNSGSGAVDNNTLIITDPIPANTTLFTGNLSGGAPYTFTNGTPSCGLTCNFTALNNTTDCIDFSTDNGATWTAVPNGGYDASINSIRFKPAGSMSGDSTLGAPSPNFSLVFKVKVN